MVMRQPKSSMGPGPMQSSSMESGPRRNSHYLVYRDFIRDHGAPSALRRDNAKEEQSEEVKEINREFMIKDQMTEAYHPQQNPVESNAIRYLKAQIHVLMDRTGAPD